MRGTDGRLWFARNLNTALCAQMLHPDVSGHTVGFFPVGPGRGWVGPFVDARTVIPFIAIGLGLEDECVWVRVGWSGETGRTGKCESVPQCVSKEKC